MEREESVASLMVMAAGDLRAPIVVCIGWALGDPPLPLNSSLLVGRLVKDPDKLAGDCVLPQLYAKEKVAFIACRMSTCFV